MSARPGGPSQNNFTSAREKSDPRGELSSRREPVKFIQSRVRAGENVVLERLRACVLRGNIYDGYRDGFRGGGMFLWQASRYEWSDFDDLLKFLVSYNV